MGNFYTEDSFEHLPPLEFTRLKPQVYCGNCTYSTQLLIEVISNSVDEFNIGHGDKIYVTLDKDKVTVKDEGQGFPVNVVKIEGKTILEAAFSLINTSGKYRTDGTYEGTSLGNFGIGAKLPIFLSHSAEVYTVNGGKYEKIWFKEGVFEKREVGTTKEHTGTTVTWYPSEEFFTNTTVEMSRVKEYFKTISCLCPGLSIILNDNGKETTYLSENGLADLIDYKVKDIEIIDNRLLINAIEDKYRLNLAMTYTSNYAPSITAYVNTGATDSGAHITQLKTTLTREMNKFFKEKKWLKETDANLTGDDISEGLYIVFNYTAPNVKYDAQVKSRVSEIDTKFLTSAFGNELQYWMESNEKDLKAIVDKALIARKAREAAKKAREAIREGEKKKKEKVVKFDTKLADCFSKDRKKCEIYITEGDSASGNLKTARDNEFQAVMPVRGKVLNCQKATLAQIQKNAEIMTMIDAFGLKIDHKTMKVTFDESDIRYGKIIIMSDADVDGAHIKNLFYTFIWNFCPELIEKGYIYAGVPPLYKITLGGNKGYKYLKNDEALEQFKKDNVGKKYQVNRMKGLGEMGVEETEETLTDPNNRIIKQITVEDVKATDILFEELMGTAITARKNYIKEHSKDGGQYNAE